MAVLALPCRSHGSRRSRWGTSGEPARGRASRLWLVAVWQWTPEDDGGVHSCLGRLRFLSALLRCFGLVSPTHLGRNNPRTHSMPCGVSLNGPYQVVC